MTQDNVAEMSPAPASSSKRGLLAKPITLDRVRYVAGPVGDVASDGFQFMPRVLSPPDVRQLSQGVEDALEQLSTAATVPDDDGRVRRDDEGRVRMAYGTHLLSPDVDAIARTGPWVRAISKALQQPVYLYQSKLTINPACSVAGWGWHIDFGPWQRRDTVPEPHLISAIVFLDDVGDESGGLSVVERSARTSIDETLEIVAKLEAAQSNGDDDSPYPVSPVGPAGSVLLLNALTVHGSASNRSSAQRRMLILTYNRCTNLPKTFCSSEWLCARDTAPLADTI
jgi:L-proline 4-hydroxylase